MELHELNPEKLINPSKLKYIVPISQPFCHKINRMVPLKNKKPNKNNFLKSYSSNSEFENFMKEMRQIKMRNIFSLKKKKKNFI